MGIYNDRDLFKQHLGVNTSSPSYPLVVLQLPRRTGLDRRALLLLQFLGASNTAPNGSTNEMVAVPSGKLT